MKKINPALYFGSQTIESPTLPPRHQFATELHSTHNQVTA